MKKNHVILKPQDILIALKIILIEKSLWKLTDLSISLEMSQSEVSQGLARLAIAKLIDLNKKHILRASLLEFLIYGLKYVYPAILGPIVRGIPTAHSAKLDNLEIFNDSKDIFVWEFANGQTRGQALLPLYKSVPQSAMNDDSLYELLALIDVIRIGRVREIKMAKQILEKKIMNEK